MKRFRLVGLAAVVALVVAFAGVGRPDRASSSGTDTSMRTITVNGTGIVTSVPDRAQFSFGVTTTAKSASAALTANSADMTKVIDTLRTQASRRRISRPRRCRSQPTTTRPEPPSPATPQPTPSPF